MKRLVPMSLGVMAGVFVAGSALADEGKGTGIDLGLRTGYGFAMGSAVKNGDLSDGVKGQVPIWVDAGYRFTPNIMAGLYFSYGFGIKGDHLCPSPLDCSVHDMRLGVQGQYRFSPDQDWDPWLGVGLGFEWLGTSADGSAGGVHASASTTFSGFEFLDLQGGADYSISEQFGLGPFISFSLAQYNSASTSCSGAAAGVCGADGDIHDKALHEWLMLGLRGVFVL
jgi:hypothetical protein